MGKEPSIQTILARSYTDQGVYAIRTMKKRAASAPDLKCIRSEQKCLRIVTESNCPFLPKLHRSFQDEARLYMVLVSLIRKLSLFLIKYHRICIRVVVSLYIWIEKGLFLLIKHDSMLVKS